MPVSQPGDRVQIVGVYRPLPQSAAAGSMSGIYRTILVANSVKQLDRESRGPKLSDQDIKNIKTIASELESSGNKLKEKEADEEDGEQVL